MPESFLLDSNGIIMKRVIGAHDWVSEVDRALIRRLLGDTVPGASRPSLDRAAPDTLPAQMR